MTRPDARPFARIPGSYRSRRAEPTRTHAGQGLEDNKNVPALVLCFLGVVALGTALTAAGYGFAGWSIVAGIICAVCLVAGVTWLVIEGRRTSAAEPDRQGH
ncbi:hypothetical protein [Nocardia aurantia]|uniref:UsfY protein n=1 Tax=Nocardia aurantia TaxID=2585199 RepID=A0A7K0DQ21_9NOCA|nr:hypothetical protein [Nocardia aurantia]MQY27801.1 hypothetical protein [Nocardia aurantia]